MGILRTDILTHSQLEPSGSVFFDGNSDYLSWSNDSVKVIFYFFIVIFS